jgi:Fic-DOC domain mobile mystery protein B
MSFILNPKLSDGNTPIRPEEAEQLIPRISTMAELNEYEALNIVQARDWAFKRRTMKSSNPLGESYVRTLHARMFGKVWKWAGTYRSNELNIGCDPSEIVQRIPQLLANTQHWIDQKVFSLDESVLRFHYDLASTIHPFSNGNGRHARMMADVIVVKYGSPEFSWGARRNLAVQGAARAAYLAALRALDADSKNIQPLLAFARS